MNGDLGRGRVRKVRELVDCEVCCNKSRSNVDLTYPLQGYVSCGPPITTAKVPRGRTLRICVRCAAKLAAIAQHQHPPTDANARFVDRQVQTAFSAAKEHAPGLCWKLAPRLGATAEIGMGSVSLMWGKNAAPLPHDLPVHFTAAHVEDGEVVWSSGERDSAEEAAGSLAFYLRRTVLPKTLALIDRHANPAVSP